MEYTQKRIVQECFDGARERNCSYCPAHYSKGGICCFGHRYEYDDEQCLSCSHNDACEPLTYQLQEQRVERPRRPTTTRRRLPIYGHTSGETKGNLLTEQGQKPSIKTPDRVEPEVITYLPTKQPGEGKWSHFFKGMGLIGAWGAGEGALELILNYMRERRPR